MAHYRSQILDKTLAMTPGSIILAHPGWLWLLPALLVAALIWRYLGEPDEDTGLSSGSAPKRHCFNHPMADLIPGEKAGQGGRLGLLLFLWLVLACLVVALSQPVRIGKQLPEPPRERDIVFIVDTSLSMVLRDYVLNDRRIERINLLKNLLKQFVLTLTGERISIVVFGETADTLVPLTRDQQLLTEMISRISAGMVGRYNAVGDAIALAVREAGDVRQRGQILVLFTDAGQHTGRIEPLAAAQLAAEAGLPLYTIAIGASTHEAAEQDRHAGLLYQTVDMGLLDALAEATKGASYQAGDSDALEQAVADITSHKQYTATQQQVHYVREPLYIWPLGLGLLLFFSHQMRRLLRSATL